MRIAIPVVSGEVFSPLANAEAFHFYEDDHGTVSYTHLTLPTKRIV